MYSLADPRILKLISKHVHEHHYEGLAVWLRRHYSSAFKGKGEAGQKHYLQKYLEKSIEPELANTKTQLMGCDYSEAEKLLETLKTHKSIRSCGHSFKP
jgi:hypothetical protein